MKCRGNFIYKAITKRDAGEFTNNNGELIKYNESYILKVDEITNEGIYERTFRIAIDSPIVKALENSKPYDDIVIEFDVRFYNNRNSVIPVAIVK